MQLLQEIANRANRTSEVIVDDSTLTSIDSTKYTIRGSYDDVAGNSIEIEVTFDFVGSGDDRLGSVISSNRPMGTGPSEEVIILNIISMKTGEAVPEYEIDMEQLELDLIYAVNNVHGDFFKPSRFELNFSYDK